MKRIQTEFQCSFLKFSVNLGGIKGGGNNQITKANRMCVCVFVCVYIYTHTHTYLNLLHKLKENDTLL